MACVQYSPVGFSKARYVDVLVHTFTHATVFMTEACEMLRCSFTCVLPQTSVYGTFVMFSHTPVPTVLPSLPWTQVERWLRYSVLS